MVFVKGIAKVRSSSIKTVKTHTGKEIEINIEDHTAGLEELIRRVKEITGAPLVECRPFFKASLLALRQEICNIGEDDPIKRVAVVGFGRFDIKWVNRKEFGVQRQIFFKPGQEIRKQLKRQKKNAIGDNQEGKVSRFQETYDRKKKAAHHR